MSSSRSLLEKYDIPVSYLDYGYINECNNPKTLEKIVAILRSGQEGYFPDLTRHAEEKLKSLKPRSKILRTEDPLLTRHALSSAEWKEVNEPVMDWINDMRKKDRVLLREAEKGVEMTLKTPPIREGSKKIEPGVEKPENKMNQTKTDRIRSTEYAKWDKYDADTEELKIDLEEERVREEIERKNRRNLEKTAHCKQDPVDNTELCTLTDIEKEKLALQHKERGNDYFRAKEYKEAIWEYTQGIKIIPSVNGYNNRALAFMKLNDYQKCIEDCDKCLELDSRNIKALLRKAQALLNLDKRRDAYDVYVQIVLFEPGNITANNQIKDLQKQLPDLPPISATRIRIIEEDSSSGSQQDQSNKDAGNSFALGEENANDAQSIDRATLLKKESKGSSTGKDMKRGETKSAHLKQEIKAQCPENDLAKLIMPNKVVKSKLKAAVEKLGSLQKQSKVELQKAAKKKSDKPPEMQIQLEKIDRDNCKNKVLIEEI